MLKACSHGATATAIYLSQLIGCMGHSVIVVIGPYEHLHSIPYHPLVKEIAVITSPCEQALACVYRQSPNR